MAEDQQSSQERTEQPTARRKQEARKKGQVARSRELNTMLSLLSVAAGVLVMGGWMAVEFPALVASSLSLDRAAAFDSALVPVRFVEMVMSSVLLLTPLFAVAIVGALIGPMVMGGFVFSASAMSFKLEKINPLTGLKRIFSPKGLMELLKALFKFVVLTAVTVVLFTFLLDDILELGSLVPDKAFAESAGMLAWSLLILSFAMIAIVMFDVPFELWNHNRQLKMTRREVQDELKETEGRPEVRNRIRALQREVSQRRMMEDTREADVVITNPQHFSVALKYDEAPGKAPVVVAKGRDLVALKIRTVAIENDVAIFEAPPLARALYASTEIGQEIPENLYLVVAKVLAYVYQLRNSRRNEYTPMPEDLSVPEEYRDLFTEGLDND
ncbi:MAG: flagellar biosynthesis protein FlhB [Halioglobus sp.]|nr:flagellar biosynthesis protein FlhB [Halioglobus sp.]